jgi:tripartite-type tricarboxylate transporter receptor subunit TctC
MLRKRHYVWVAVIVAVAIFGLIAAGCGGQKQAQQKNYPTKPVQLIIPWPAGGASDLSTRALAKYAEKELGQPITPVNQDGANGATAWAEAVKARPDGYTIVMVTFDIMTNQALGRSPTKYNDFEYLLQFTSQPLAFVVKSDSPYKTLADLLNAAKANPGTLKVATTPLGGIYHQALAMVEKDSGAKFRVVPFAGAAEVNTALLGGHVDAQVNTLTLLDAHVKNGTFRVLAVTSEKRSPRFPDAPTLKELGFNTVHESFRAIAVPKNTPPEVKKALSDAFTKAYNNKEFQQAADKAKFDIYYRSPEDFGKFLDALYPKVQAVLAEAGIKR